MRALTDRATTNPSNNCLEKTEEKKHVIRALSANGYTRRFILEASKQLLTSLTPEQTDPEFFVTLPHVAGTSEPIKRILNNFGIKTTFKPFSTICYQFPKPKNPTPLEQLKA